MPDYRKAEVLELLGEIQGAALPPRKKLILVNSLESQLALFDNKHRLWQEGGWYLDGKFLCKQSRGVENLAKLVYWQRGDTEASLDIQRHFGSLDAYRRSYYRGLEAIDAVDTEVAEHLKQYVNWDDGRVRYSGDWEWV